MIVNKIVGGYIASYEQVAKCAEAFDIPFGEFEDQVMVRIKILQLLEEEYHFYVPIITKWPRCNPRQSHRYIMCCTQTRRSVDHTFVFPETPRDREVLTKSMKANPVLRILLEDAKFVTVPDPAGTMLLPGEYEVCSIHDYPSSKRQQI